MELGLSGKRVVITGGSKGIGLACAHAFLHEGARVSIIGRDLENLHRARVQLQEEGLHVSTHAADLADFAEAQRVIAEIEDEHGPIDVLINSAGAARRHHPDALDGETLRIGIERKFFPVANTQIAVLERMRTRGKGVIVNIIGVGGKVPGATHIPGGAANAALMLTTVGQAQHFAAQGIRINAINPGHIFTDRVQQAVDADAERFGISSEEALRRGEAAVPLGRYGAPEEIANVALFLASDKASYIVGALVPVDGGRHASV